MAAGTPVRWAVRHGVARAVTRHAARRGNLTARVMCDPAAMADPFPLYDQLRARGPFVPMGGRLGVATASYEAATAVLRGDDFRAGLSFDGAPRLARAGVAWTHDDRLIGPIDRPSLLVADPPDHTRYRRLVAKLFTARAVESLRRQVEQLADDLLDRLAGEQAGAVDLVDGYANRLPVTVIAHILAVPPEMVGQFLAWSAQAATTLDVGIGYREFRQADAALRDANRWLHGHFERLRRNPGDDILSKLAGAENDERLTETELTAIAQLVLAAGYVTTVDLLGNGIVLLLANPNQLAGLRDDPAGWPNAVEEILRYDSPVQVSGRFAAHDTQVCGVDVPTGRFVLTLLGGANRDPAVFDDAHRFDVRRPNARDHIAFSRGIHYCLGAALARMEGEVGLRRLFDRFPDLALAGPPRRRPTGTLRGYDNIPATLRRA